MKIGFIGLGKLGLPCALAIDSKGHDVVGYDINPRVSEILESKVLPYREEGAPELLENTNLKFGTVADVVSHADLIFVPIQTPHDPRFEGITSLTDERKDFDYTYLEQGMKALSDEIEHQGREKIVSIISTVLPGTVKSRIRPLLGEHTKLCYNPFFIAMGTTVRDFLYPEFILLGVDDPEAAERVEQFYGTITDAPVYRTAVENAELIKVSYNTFIGMKIVFVNTLMEICHKMNLSVDDVTGALMMAKTRLISPKYLEAGMGDGGGCHPRDNIAMSWLARNLDLSYDFFESLMTAREKQNDWLADLIMGYDLPTVILGKAFKPETALTVGSPSILLKNQLEARGRDVVMYDPHVDDEMPGFGPSLFFVGTKHPEFLSFKFPTGSVVLDPWRYIPAVNGITVIPIGHPDRDQGAEQGIQKHSEAA